MIGQKKILYQLRSYFTTSFPRSLLLLGDKGCGKHEICKLIKDKLNLDLIDLTETIDSEIINQIYIQAIPMIYMIDLSKMIMKDQNILLKFVEEPLKNAYIILLGENKNNILETIINRCIVLMFEKYSKEELSQFVSDNKNKDLLLEICTTPGQLKTAVNTNLTELCELCEKILDKLELASYPNTLSISDKLNYKDTYDKFDPVLFLDVIILRSFDKYFEENLLKYKTYWEITREYREKLVDSRLNKQYIIENYLTCLWKVAHQNG